jgi:predicted oxidoreductase
MQDQKEPTQWHIIENQITRLRVFESQIEDLRRLLAEDWQARLSRREHSAPGPVASFNCRPVDTVHFEHAGNPAFSAC